MEDDAVIQKVLQGDIEAFSLLVEKYKDLVYSIAYQVVGNTEDAKDIVQETFIKVFKSLRSHRSTAKFSSWLYKIACTTAISKKRSYRFHIDYLEDGLDIRDFSQLEAIFTNLHRIDQDKIIRSALERLEIEERLLLTLFYFNELPVIEIASITGLASSNVKVRIFRIRKKLFQYLKQHFSEVQNDML